MISEINLGKMTSINLQIDCIVDPVIFFNKFSMSKNTLLLMSSEIDSKKKQESLMILESAVKIVAHDRLISVIALTENGKDLLTHLLNIFSETEISKVSQDEIQIKFESQTDSKISEDERLRCEGPFSIVRKIIASIDCLESKSDLFLGGNFSYDFIETFEKLAPVSKSETSCPYFTLYVAQLMAKVDHSTGKSKLQTCLFGGKSYTRSFHEYSRKMGEIKKSYGQLSKKEFDNTTFPESNSFNYEMNISDEEFAKHVSNIKQKIIEGDIFQAVLSRTFKMSCNNALKCFRNLIGINPGPYMFYMNDDDFELFGSSPESALKFLAKERSIHIYPIAGTRRRGLKEDGTIDLDLDGRHELELRMCEKEVAEHMMLVDLARNDVAKISQTGTRFVSPLMKVDRYSRVMHLVSQVNGILKEDLDALHAYQATMNMGTLTGAPKISAINIVRNIEKQERGPYGGAVGYITGEGNFDTCIVIRSAFVKNKMAYVQAGAGVVYDSDPMAEAMETKDKAHAVIKAIQLSEDQYE